MNARGLAVLIAVLLLVGCTAHVEDEGCEEMGTRKVIDGTHNRIEHWGAAIPFKAPWRENDVRPLIFKPPYKDLYKGHPTYCVPQAQSILLASRITGPGLNAANYAFRWQLKIGGGGGQATVLLDMLNIQQIAIAAENINVEVLCEKIDQGGTAGPFTPPDVTVSASASFADGNVSSGQATYTQGFDVTNGTTLTLGIPAMATSWRILGADGSARFPLVAGVNFFFDTSGASGGPVYAGDKLAPEQYSGSYIDVPGTARDFAIQNTTGLDVQGLIQWGLDL